MATGEKGSSIAVVADIGATSNREGGREVYACEEVVMQLEVATDG